MNQPKYIIRPHGQTWFLIETGVRVVIELDTKETCECVRDYLEGGLPPADDPRWALLYAKMLVDIAQGEGSPWRGDER